MPDVDFRPLELDNLLGIDSIGVQKACAAKRSPSALKSTMSSMKGTCAHIPGSKTLRSLGVIIEPASNRRSASSFLRRAHPVLIFSVLNGRQVSARRPGSRRPASALEENLVIDRKERINRIGHAEVDGVPKRFAGVKPLGARYAEADDGAGARHADRVECQAVVVKREQRVRTSA